MRTTIADSFTKAPPPSIVGKPKRIANNTFRYATEDGRVVTRLHLTDIVEQLPKGVRLSTGGWKTSTTKARLNDALRSLGYSIWSDRGVWYVHDHGRGERVPFYDGIVLPDAFTKPSVRRVAERQAKAQAKLKADIKKFVSTTLATGKEIPLPHGGDCWDCQMFDKEDPVGDTKYLGGASERPTRARNNHHLLEHVREGYMHGSLIVNAFRAAGFQDLAISFWTGWGGGQPDYTRLRRVVTRYLQKRLGLPA